MNARINNSGNKVRQAVLAGILTLTGSAVAMAAVPEAPQVDWVDTQERQSTDGQHVEVNVGWSRFDFEEVSSVQYRLNGMPVMSRVVEEGQTFGEAAFAIDSEGDFDVSIALCNIDGCAETTGATISISERDGVDVSYEERSIPAEQFAVRDTNSGAASGGQDLMFLPQLDGPQIMGAGLASSLATKLGKAALSGLAKEGGSQAFKAVMNALGLGGDEVSAQLSELKSSINALNGQISDLTKEIRDFRDESIWGDFVTQHTLANIEVNAIYTAFGNVTGWLNNGVQPDYNAWSTSRSNVESAISALASSDLNAGQGIVDMRDGSIYQLMNAIPQRVASVDSYWKEIDEYRDYYRAALAVGFLALDLIEDNFDTTGTTRVIADNALSASQTAVLNMYAYGVAPKLPVSGVDVLDFVQLRSETTGYAAAEYAVLDDSAEMRLAGADLISGMKELAASYRPDHHDGLTLQEFLTESNVPTTYFLNTSGGWESRGWELRKVKDAVPHMEEPPIWEVRPRIGEIKGNQWKERYISLCPTNPDLCGGSASDGFYAWYSEYGGTEAQKIRDKISARKSALRNHGGFVYLDLFPAQAKFAESHYAKIDLTDSLNHAGRMADFDEDAVWVAAFGDGSVTLAAGELPGEEGSSACIGLPSQDLTLLQVGDYEYQWLANGNLVLRNGEPGNLWASKTSNKANKLCFMPKGNLLVMSDNLVKWESNTGDGALGGFGGRELKLFPDGTVQIVNELEDVVWQKGPFE